MSELKHIGRVKATGKKCLVAYRTLPGDAYSCLIVPTENLPDAYHDSLINLVESPAGQESHEFAEAMARTTFPDGSTILPALHGSGRLIKVPTDAIEMTPTTSISILLSELNQIIAEQRGIPLDELSIKPSIQEKKPEPKVEKKAETTNDASKTTSASVNETAPEVQSFDSVEAEAKHYRSQADKLAKQAAEFRRKAEELVPTKKSK